MANKFNNNILIVNEIVLNENWTETTTENIKLGNKDSIKSKQEVDKK